MRDKYKNKEIITTIRNYYSCKRNKLKQTKQHKIPKPLTSSTACSFEVYG